MSNGKESRIQISSAWSCKVAIGDRRTTGSTRGYLSILQHCCKIVKVLREFEGFFTKNLSKFNTFWGAALNELPVVALIDSGNKSLHAWIRVPDVHTFEEWKIKIEQKFFEQCLKPLGIDTACKNPSRMSRLPGCIRKETGRWQRLLYLNPEAERDD